MLVCLIKTLRCRFLLFIALVLANISLKVSSRYEVAEKIPRAKRQRWERIETHIPTVLPVPRAIFKGIPTFYSRFLVYKTFGQTRLCFRQRFVMHMRSQPTPFSIKDAVDVVAFRSNG